MNFYFKSPDFEEELKFNFKDNRISFLDHSIDVSNNRSHYIRKVINHKPYFILCALRKNQVFVSINGHSKEFDVKNEQQFFREKFCGDSNDQGSSLVSQMPGKIVKVLVGEGDKIQKGQALLIMEAMKMENELRASFEGEVEKVHVKNGDAVESKTTLISFKDNDNE